MIIGVTGRIASGKSKYSKSLVELLDFTYIECDGLIAQQKIYTNWYKMQYSEYLNLLINDKGFRNRVNEDCARYIIDNYLNPQENIVIESAILFTSGLARYCDKTVRVVAPTEIRMERMKQRGYDQRFIYDIEMIQTESGEDNFKTNVTY